jgi:hypothetical protein
MATLYLPTPEQVYNSASASYWLKDALRQALNRDCVDAYYDAKQLADMLKDRMDKALGRVTP